MSTKIVWPIHLSPWEEYYIVAARKMVKVHSIPSDIITMVEIINNIREMAMSKILISSADKCLNNLN